MPTYYFNCIDSVEYTVNLSFAFWSILNHFIFQIFSICSWSNLWMWNPQTQELTMHERTLPIFQLCLLRSLRVVTCQEQPHLTTRSSFPLSYPHAQLY